MRSAKVLAAVLSGFLLGSVSFLAAQTITGTIAGSLADKSGAVIAGGSVTLVEQQTGQTRTLKSNPEGRFFFAALLPSTYALKVEATGFQSLEQKGIVVSANENVALGQLTLQVGQASETVTVTEGGARVETESSDLTARLTSDQIDLISTKGRDVTSLLRLIPGTSFIDDIEAVGEGFGTDLPNISGQRGRSTVSSVDGLNASEPSGSNKLSMTVNQDAVAEVKVLRNNYAAEYGNNGGALINLVTKSGGQQYHGTAYYFLRNEALNANSYINNANVTAGVWSPLPRPLYRHNVWGVTLGGPVKVPFLFPNKDRKKVYFFYSYEKPHTITPQDTRLVTVPTALERAGDFSQSITGFTNGVGNKAFVRDPNILTGNCTATDSSACFRDPSRATAANPLGLNIIPQGRFNASGLALLNVFPLPNTSGRTDGINYITQQSQNTPKWSQIARVDVKLTQNDSIYWKAQWWTADNEGLATSGWPGASNGFDHVNRWGISSHYLYKDNGTSLNWVHILNPRLVNEVAVGVRHDSEGFIPSTGWPDKLSRTTTKYNAPQLFPQNNHLGLIPRATDFRGVAGAPANINWLDRWGEIGNDYVVPSVTDNLSWSRGTHVFKTGIYYEKIRNGEAPGGNWTGTFSFRSNDSNYTAALGNTGFAYANALVGDFLSYTEGNARPFTNLEFQQAQWYIQDEWKAHRRLSVNYGLRFAYHTQWFQRDGLASNFDPSSWDPTKAPLLFLPFCTSGTPAAGGTACPTANRRAQNPATGALSTNLNFVGTIVPNTGDLANGLALMTNPRTPAGFKRAKPVDFEPRVGISWDMFGHGKSVLHAMGGVYHAPRAGGGTTGGNLVNNPPQLRNFSISNLPGDNIDNLVNLAAQAVISVPSLNAVEVETQTPTSYNFSLGMQQDIGFKTVMEVAYVGSQSRHLGERRNINGVPDGAKWVDCRFITPCQAQNIDPFNVGTATNLASPRADNFLRPYRGYADINVVQYVGNSNYNALQVQVNRRYTKRFQYGAAYTWSKTMDSANDDSSDVFNSRPYRRFNYGVSDFDQTHIFTANYIYELPSLARRWDHRFVDVVFGGWQISGTTSLVSGKPKTGLGTSNVTYSGTQTATNITDFTGGEVQARPKLVCDPNGRPGTFVNGLPVLFNTTCFGKPGVRGDIGDVPRNFVRLPGLINTDLAVFKNFHAGERANVQFRWEAYNLFNHTNFRDVNSNMTFDATGAQTTANFGTVSSVRPNRVMQGSLRFSF